MEYALPPDPSGGGMIQEAATPLRLASPCSFHPDYERVRYVLGDQEIVRYERKAPVPRPLVSRVLAAAMLA